LQRPMRSKIDRLNGSRGCIGTLLKENQTKLAVSKPPYEPLKSYALTTSSDNSSCQVMIMISHEHGRW
jgi:hypothetical protein